MQTRVVRFCLVLAAMLMLAEVSAYSSNQNQPSKPSRLSASAQRDGKKLSLHPEQSSQSGLSFASPVTYGTGGYGATSVAIGDLNGDGKPDLVVTSCANSNCTGAGLVGVLLGNGDGTFKTAVTYSSGGQNPKSVAIADVNNDGKPDLVVANLCANPCVTDGTVAILLGNGDGTFQPAVNYDSGGSQAESVAVADMNGDGKLDIVVADNNLVGVLLGNGDGTFQPAVTYNSGGDTLWVALGDLNGDGKPDVAVALDSGDLGVLLNNGDGTLQPVVLYSSGGSENLAVALADLSGNNKLDAVVANTNKPFNVGVLLGNGDGTFQPVVVYGVNDQFFGPFMVAVADVNGDGKLDLVMPNGGSCLSGSAVSILPGNGDGTFQSDVDFCLSARPTDLAVADLNGDGRPDVAATTGSTVTVLINTSTTAVLSPSSLSFAPQTPGTKSTQQTVTLTNIAAAALPISGISITGTDASGFSQTNNCPSSLAANASCQINVTSDPQTGGAQSASLSIADNLVGSPQTIALTGTGEDFSMSASPTSDTVTPGQAANYTVTLAPLSGFSQKVALSCSGAPAQSTCTVTPSSVTMSGSANATASVAVVTAGSSSRMLHPGFGSGSSRFALWLGLPGLSGLLLCVGARSHSRKRRVQWLRMLALLGVMSLVIIWPACGGGSSGSGGSGSGTPAGTYTVTVTGTFTSGSVTLSHNTKLTLVVQ